jgi:hypothetical protein
MSEIIRELFNGEIQPGEYFYIFDDDFNIAEKELKENLSDKQKELFKAYKAARSNYENEIAFNNFDYGYRTACKLVHAGLK